MQVKTYSKRVYAIKQALLASDASAYRLAIANLYNGQSGCRYRLRIAISLAMRTIDTSNLVGYETYHTLYDIRLELGDSGCV